MPVLSCLQITLQFLTSVFLEDANFTNSLHLTLQPPVICSLDKTGLQTSVIVDCLHLLTLSTWTPTEPILNRCVKNKSSYFPLHFFLAVLFSFCLIVLLIFPTHLTRNFCISHAWLLISLSSLCLIFFLLSFLLFCSFYLYLPESVIILEQWLGCPNKSQEIFLLRPILCSQAHHLTPKSKDHPAKDEFRRSEAIIFCSKTCSLLSLDGLDGEAVLHYFHHNIYVLRSTVPRKLQFKGQRNLLLTYFTFAGT